MSSTDAPVPPLPGVGARRKGPKTLPKLPLSAFSPPNTGTSERFPLPPSPSTVHPDHPVDAHVAGEPAAWAAEAGDVLGKTSGGIVLELKGDAADALKSFAESKTIGGVPVLAVSVPLSSRTDTDAPGVHYHATLQGVNPEAIASVRSALEAGKTVDLYAPVESEEQWDALEEFLGKVTAASTSEPPQPPPGVVVLSNILPPPDDLSMAIVKLLNHPSYRAYQTRTASLSLISNVLLKFRPPRWGAPTPPTPHVVPPPSDEDEASAKDTKEKTEWKRRLKMYIGPAFEAFGEERIIFGSAPVPDSNNESVVSDWYELARESIAELGVEQETIDAIFSGNAKRAYPVA